MPQLAAMRTAAKAVCYAWLGYLHLFFALHQPILPWPGAVRDALLATPVGLPAFAARSCHPVVARGGGVRRSPPTQTELNALAMGFKTLQSAANSQRKPAARDALRQLGWHWNKAVLDNAASSGNGAARLAATQAVDIAASTWPYWMAWPETHLTLALALGSESSASVAVDQARTRFPPQRWQGWWREQQPRWDDGSSNREQSSGSAVLPPPRRIVPFASMVMLCACLCQLCHLTPARTAALSC